MLQKLLFFVLLCSVLQIAANPLDPYTAPFISEVLINDSLDWSIELNALEYHGENKIIRTLPLTHDTIEIRLFLRTKTYITRLSFDTAGIAVLNRKSIIGIPSQEKVILKNTDTVKVTTAADTINGYSRYFYFPLKPVKKGNSLIRYYSIRTPFETSRTTIGKPNGPFNTIYNFTVIDKNSKPISNFFVYHYIDVTMPSFGYLFRTDTSGQFHYTTEINKSVRLDIFKDSIPNNAVPKGLSDNMGSIFTWKGGYIDTLQTKDVLIAVDMTSTIPRFKRSVNFKFKTIQLSNEKQLLMISSVQAFPNAFVNINDLSGKLITSIQTPILEKGTYSFIFNSNQKKISNGHYICALIADGKVRNTTSLIVK